jgi:hypothetical protein
MNVTSNFAIVPLFFLRPPNGRLAVW